MKHHEYRKQMNLSHAKRERIIAVIAVLVMILSLPLFWQLRASEFANSSTGKKAIPSIAQAALSPALDDGCTGIVQRARSGNSSTVFIGDSNALQVMRMSALFVTECLRAAKMLEADHYQFVQRRAAELHMRIAKANAVEHLVVPLYSWDMRFIKAPYVSMLPAALDRLTSDTLVNCSKHQDVFIISGTWDIARPVKEHSGVIFDGPPTSEADEAQAMAEFTSTVKRHLREAANRVQRLPCASRVRTVLPLLPNCSASKFHRVSNKNQPTTILASVTRQDPYQYVQGDACHTRLYMGTAMVVRSSMQSGQQGVVDVLPLLSSPSRGKESGAAAGNGAAICTSSDGAHLDDFTLRFPLLTTCARHVMRALWI